MKTLILGMLAMAPVIAADGAMNSAERTFLLEQLEETKKGVLASINGLTRAQWTFKPAPGVWSVQECAEHIILAEDFIRNSAKQVLQTPAVDRLPTGNPETDRKLVARIQDRSQKLTAPEPIVPAGKFATPADAEKEFTARRDATIAYVTSTNDELRTHVANGPAGPMDVYQFLVLLSSHSARHTAQIREVEANSAYPKKSAAE